MPQKYNQAEESELHQMMDAMDANLDKQDGPKVGIFWYSPRIKDVFGIVAVDAASQAKIEERDTVTCKELHKYVWAKKYNFYKYHGGSDLYSGDYKYTPRGRVFYVRSRDTFCIMVGNWISDYPEAIPVIKKAFNLDKPELNVEVKTGPHWEIGMGYGD